MGGQEIRALGQSLGMGVNGPDIGELRSRNAEQHMGNRDIDLADYVILVL